MVKPQLILRRRPFSFLGKAYVVLVHTDQANSAEVRIGVYTEGSQPALSRGPAGLPVQRVCIIRKEEAEDEGTLNLLMEGMEIEFLGNSYP